MNPLLGLAFVFGVVAGLRTFTAPAAALLALHHRVAGLIVAALAAGELVMDAMPNTPSRTAPVGLGARIVSGAFVGWLVAQIPGACVGVLGALVGTYGGHRLRAKAITRIGAIPAALTEDAVTLVIAVLAAVRLGA